MNILLIILLILSGIIFVGSVLLMSPKGGLGAAIGGMGGSDEYGSKKSMEGKLKKVAIVSISIFVVTALILPYVN
ncbi:MAG TPA: preprotein translocase subunit SecG [Candidatus Absconditabacterales bacterium]|nr:preprotein translocase subunit SecG [Candidatus Absconditabacterales bacterium]